MTILFIRPDDLTNAAVRDLLAHHHREMHGASPPGTAFALDLDGLRQPGISVWSAWIGDSLAGIAALKALGGGSAEIKSMRTHPDHLRKGVAAALLDHLLAEARRAGLARLSLETGTGALFDPALSLYRSRGFVDGPAFGDSAPGPYNQFLHRVP